MNEALTRNLLTKGMLESAGFEERQMLAAGEVDDENLKEHNFDDGTAGSLGTFDTSIASLGDFSNGTYNPRFDQDLYNENIGDRVYQGHEIAGDVYFNEEGFSGFNMYVPSYNPTDANYIVHQFYNWADTASWAQVLEIQDGDLWLNFRDGPDEYIFRNLIYEDLPTDQWNEFKLRLQPGGEFSGRSTVVMNEEVIYDATNLNIGWSDDYTYNEDGSMPSGLLGAKQGIYAYDGDTNHGDLRLYFDDVSNVGNDDGSLNAQTAWDRVDPDITN